MTRLALELIGQSGLGYSFDPLTEGGDTHPYVNAAKQLAYVYFPGTMGYHQILLTIFHKANFIQVRLLSDLYTDNVGENWNSFIPTICRESFALEGPP